ncbi:hypothetical protein H6768_06340 [Candidatus Peribacteria bacterium]|nr:hypothetical protein [Candidatus Peribacteria bacterium]
MVDVPNRDTIEVGQDIPLNFSIQRQDGSIVDDWDMSVNIGIQGGNASLLKSTLTFVNGRASTVLHTGTRTGTISLFVKDAGL